MTEVEAVLTENIQHRLVAVGPLDGQFGVHPALSIPPEAADFVFATSSADPSLRTYALFDAGRVEGLPERLETEGVAFDCLVSGPSRDSLGAVSPWLVALAPDSRLCRDLFTRGPAPWDLWGREACVLFQSRASLPDLVAHFRRFTRIRDRDGNWHFFRFQEPLVMRTIVMGLRPEARQEFLAPFGRVIVPDNGDVLHVFDMPPEYPSAA
ncbi:DUF4123 domain-containing protein [Jannaschia pohangensis]|uniref:DUF4123 domain-containing protein n=1 Tax=Jannaschia pohangensis TaxID=390807 RepID=A0A1I3IKP0_9RHOB|nr:DUF4123 domain-containing protein [Jannaschia pohangensis]SFI48481.1 protein of unknown function [Jannaschia pohangensis]